MRSTHCGPRHALAIICAAVIFATLTGSLAQTGGQTSPGTLGSNQVTRLPEVTVTGTNELREETPFGENRQPEWTARRRWATTRVYVHPPWQIETEFGWDATFPREGKTEHLVQQEIEIGLPCRFQLDFENHDQNFEEDAGVTNWHHDSNSLELGYALADWGVIPLNPTIKGEWKFNNGAADAYELQLLLGEELAKRWHWGLNFFFEHQIGDDRRQELAASQAISYTLIDEKVSAGAEMKFSAGSDKDTRNDPEKSFSIGPSIQWRPTRRTHLDVVPLVGIGHDSPAAELLVFFGIEFGPGSVEKEGAVPASFRGK